MADEDDQVLTGFTRVELVERDCFPVLVFDLQLAGFFERLRVRQLVVRLFVLALAVFPMLGLGGATAGWRAQGVNVLGC